MARLTRPQKVDMGGHAIETPRADHGCATIGCPGSGSMSHDNRGGGPWYCRFHFRDEVKGPITEEEAREVATYFRERARLNRMTMKERMEAEK